jgi:hypothetical protein
MRNKNLTCKEVDEILKEGLKSRGYNVTKIVQLPKLANSKFSKGTKFIYKI